MTNNWPSHFPPEVVREAYGARLAGYTIALEAWRRGLSVRVFNSRFSRFSISDGDKELAFDKSRPSTTPGRAIRLTHDKAETSAVLRNAGVPVPDSRVVTLGGRQSEGLVLAEANDLGYPVVIKPLRGSMGRDVYTNLRNEQELIEAFRYMARTLAPGTPLVVEEHFSGEDYRVLVVGDRAVAACLRKPANVTGDGHSTIEELLQAKNAVRLNNPYLCKKLITRDREFDQFLTGQGYKLQDVPEAGSEVRLRGRANASQGGDSIDRTQEIPQLVKDAALRSVSAIPGLMVAGVDVLLKRDYETTKDNFRVIELNSRPEIEINMYPWAGAGQDAPRHMLDVFFPNSKRSEDPLNESLTLNLEQLLAPLRGATADEVAVKRRPDHAYPVRRIYQHSHTGPISDSETSRIYLAARRAGVAGRCGRREGRGYVIVCGTLDRVEKFLRLLRKVIKVDASTEESWGGVVSQGFHVESGA